MTEIILGGSQHHKDVFLYTSFDGV